MDNTIDRIKLAQFGNLELLAKQIVEGFITGMHKSPFHGFSVEFAEHRIYNKGESTRHIDWKLFAKTEKMFTKKYEEETNLRCQIVIDQSSSMHFPEGQENKLHFSTYAAASIIELLKRQRDAVGLSFFDEDLSLHTAAKSSERHHMYLFSELQKLLDGYSEESKKTTQAVDNLHAIAELCHVRSLIVIFSDLMDDPSKTDELFEALNHLKHKKHEVILFHVTDKSKEIDFELENRPHTLIDMETGERIKIQPSQIKEKYKEEIQSYFKEIEMRCSKYRIDFMPADISEGYEQILLKYLIKRSKMG
ncbi:MAG: hypothetical protein ACI9G9_001251 [Psychromonas sp.]|jgi:uncharacterized protein (DUF58 family)